ncbi:serine hydrolase domain-containing protein [Arthrobacter sp. ISL-30]|uniref:serine hydrolase domain-containing protein n=1 Tax=Arthrobacter sp. ISL-30 TaxID=2819109 RepID=UPI002034D37C|nr:serine hydrolase domain-containing protein [Arthrobacter sp. ISL-30]
MDLHRTDTQIIAPGFESVAELFRSFLDQDPEYSAQLGAYHRGIKVLDISGGPHCRPDSVTGIFSCSKGMAGLVMALLVQDGLLDPDAEVVKYWPEFGAEGKATIKVAQLLSHQAGLLGIEGGLTLDECNNSDRGDHPDGDRRAGFRDRPGVRRDRLLRHGVHEVACPHAIRQLPGVRPRWCQRFPGLRGPCLRTRVRVRAPASGTGRRRLPELPVELSSAAGDCRAGGDDSA